MYTSYTPAMALQHEVPSTFARILEGCAAATLEKGLRGCTVQDMLGHAGVSRRTFYQYFNSKEDALGALYARHTHRLLSRMHAAAAEAEGDTPKIVAALDTFLEMQVEGGELLMQLHAEAMRPESALLPIREEVLDGIVALLDEHVGRALTVRLDPLVYRSMLLGIEGLCIHIERQGRFTREDAAYVRSIAQPSMVGVLMNHSRLPKRPD